MNKDKIIAQAIEAFDIEWIGDYSGGLSPKKAWVQAYHPETDTHSSTPRPFISAPTPDTEWIVLEWVQKDIPTEYNFEFWLAVQSIGHKRQQIKSRMSLGDYMNMYQIGDWAQALLSVLERSE